MFAISLIFLLTYKLAISVNPCQTPNGQDGDCTPINQCAQIFDLFQGNLSSMTVTFVRQSQCGSVRGGYPKVCCPLGSSLPPGPPSNLTSGLLPGYPDCGITVENKIWGGVRTELDEFPWMALLEYRNKNGRRSFGCAGTLINTRYVLTARHCLKRNLVGVRLGEWNTTSDPDCIKNKYVNECAPRYLGVDIEAQIPYADKTSLQNDIGLLRLSQEVKYSAFIKPICLPTTSDLLSKSHIGDKLVIAGWGMTENEKPSDVKLKATVPVKPLSECAVALRKAFLVDYPLHEAQLCAGGEKGTDSCNGDSGGPLMYKAAEWYAVGIVSFGPTNPCGRENNPAVYVRVAKHMDWILDNIKP